MSCDGFADCTNENISYVGTICCTGDLSCARTTTGLDFLNATLTVQQIAHGRTTAIRCDGDVSYTAMNGFTTRKVGLIESNGVDIYLTGFYAAYISPLIATTWDYDWIL